MNIMLAQGLRQHHSFLDLGCGPLTVGLPLIGYLDRGKYVGIDLRPEALSEAYRRISAVGLAHKNPVLITSSTFGREELNGNKFDFIWLSQLSYHLTDAQTVELFREARSRLNQNGAFIFDVINPDVQLLPGANWKGFSFHPRPLSFYTHLAADFDFNLSTRGHIEDYGYPRHLGLRSNLLLCLRPAKPL